MNHCDNGNSETQNDAENVGHFKGLHKDNLQGSMLPSRGNQHKARALSHLSDLKTNFGLKQITTIKYIFCE